MLPNPFPDPGPRRLFVGALTALSLTGCAFIPRPAPAPISTLALGGPARDPTCLVLFLPGRGDRLEDFRRHGFDRLAREHGVGCALVAVDAHLGYYRNRSVLVRLHDDVIAPARARGVQSIRLVGISLGGVGALLSLDEYPGAIDGAVLLAPFLGDKPILDEIAASGLAGWDPGPPPPPGPDRDFQRRLWRFLRTTYTPGAPDRHAAVPLWLGWGEDDGFARAGALLAAVLPPDQVRTAPGGHDWPVWRALFAGFVADGALDSGAAR
jgi:hypothetical protein